LIGCFSHPDDDGSAVASSVVEKEEPTASQSHSGRYKLFAFVTHMGKNTDSGHYVAHIRQLVSQGNVAKEKSEQTVIEGGRSEKWVIYNDSKVALSQDPPKDMAYIYFYKSV